MYAAILLSLSMTTAEPGYIGRASNGCFGVGTYSYQVQYAPVVTMAPVLAQSAGCVGSYSAARPSVIRPVRGPVRRVHAQRVIAGTAAVAPAGIAPFTAFGVAVPSSFVVPAKPVAVPANKKKVQVIVP
jgi:hypothetical protein